MPSERLDELVGRHLEGQLSEAHAAELATLLHVPENMDHFLRLSALHLTLYDQAAEAGMVKVASAESKSLLPAVTISSKRMKAMLSSDSPRTHEQSKTITRDFRLAWFGAAACLLLGLSGGLWIGSGHFGATSVREAEPSFATLETSPTSATVTRAGKVVHNLPRLALQPGDRIDVPPEGFALLTFPDKTRVTLESHASALLGEVSGAKRLRLERGELEASVAKQPAGKPMVIATAHSESTVLGTRLHIKTDLSGTRLDVTEGQVQLARTRGEMESDAVVESVLVRAGEWVRSSPGTQLATRRIGETTHDVWSAADELKFFATAGDIHVPDATVPQAYVTSIATSSRQMSTYFKPDQWIMFQQQDPHRGELFTVPDPCEIVLRFKAEKAGKVLITMVTSSSRFKNDNVGTDRIQIQAGWNDLVLPRGLFSPMPGGQPLLPSQRITVLGVWGFETGMLTLQTCIVRTRIQE